MQVSEYRTILVINNRVAYAASHHVERRNWHCVMHRLTITVSAEITSLAERLRIHQPVVFFANVWVRTEKNTPVVRNQTIHMRNPIVSYDFSAKCYKFPSYLRRAAIVEALGKVSSYRSNLANWEAAESAKRGKQPSLPQVGYVYPAMYRSGMFVCTEMYRATVNVFIRNTWDWVLVDFRKSDADYILRRCKNCKECVLALQKRGKKWFLDFVFQTSAKLPDVPIKDTSILAVDLGLSSACTCSIMTRSARSSDRNFFPLRENATPWNMR